MADSDDLPLAELLCARLCHDLAGPVGAAAAGAELLEDLGGGDPETMALVAASAQGAAARLKFFRSAFGPPPSSAQPAATLREMTEAYLRTAVSAASVGLALEWHSDAPSFDGNGARLLLNLLLLAKDCLPRGGVVTVTNAGPSLTVAARGDACLLTDEARDVLMAGKPPSGPRGAQADFTRRIGRRAGLEVTVAFTSTGLAFIAGDDSTDKGH